MTPNLVVDVGNTRIKWGLCTSWVEAFAALPPDDPTAWSAQSEHWQLPRPASWIVSGVHPERMEALASWIRQRGDSVRFLRRQDLRLALAVDQPDRVGLDRLLNAVAANGRREKEGDAVIVDVGSAITVDRLGRDGTFQGGAIFPGFRLMAQSLHDYTALLPLVSWPFSPPSWPATNTTMAIQSGLLHAVVGGIVDLICHTKGLSNGKSVVRVFLTGGDGPALQGAIKERLPADVRMDVWPEMTLEGVRLSAEALP